MGLGVFDLEGRGEGVSLKCGFGGRTGWEDRLFGV